MYATHVVVEVHTHTLTSIKGFLLPVGKKPFISAPVPLSSTAHVVPSGQMVHQLGSPQRTQPSVHYTPVSMCIVCGGVLLGMKKEER